MGNSSSSSTSNVSNSTSTTTTTIANAFNNALNTTQNFSNIGGYAATPSDTGSLGTNINYTLIAGIAAVVFAFFFLFKKG